jgi:hypothetical protein
MQYVRIYQCLYHMQNSLQSYFSLPTHNHVNITKSLVNMQGSEGGDTVSSIDDHLYHIMCGCCSLCQVYN